MRKNIGSALALYPMPVTLVGAMNDDEPTWTLVAHEAVAVADGKLFEIRPVEPYTAPDLDW